MRSSAALQRVVRISSTAASVGGIVDVVEAEVEVSGVEGDEEEGGEGRMLIAEDKSQYSM